LVNPLEVCALDQRILELQALREKFKGTHPSEDFVEIGDFTYGNPLILGTGQGTKLRIGKFCSIADNVIIFIGAEHNSDWVSTYPFNVFLSSYADIKGQPRTKGDVVIGNDVWIGYGGFGSVWRDHWGWCSHWGGFCDC